MRSPLRHDHVTILIVFIYFYRCLGTSRNCTVDYFKSHRSEFERTCSDGCFIVNTNNIIRHQCSDKLSNDEEGPVVYLCPKTSDTTNNNRMYIANYGWHSTCSIYKDVNESCGILAGKNLTKNTDLLCGCDYFKVDQASLHCRLTNDTQRYCVKKTDTDYYTPITADTERCNTEVHCVDGADEIDCDKSLGLYCDDPEQDGTGFKKFIVNKLICDGKKQCPDGKDEKNCTDAEGMYCTVNGTFITKSMECDYYTDCENGSDESKERCSKNYCNSTTNPSNEIMIDDRTRCNGKPECIDFRDEINCTKDWGSGVQCENGTKYVKDSKVCDNVTDCSDGKDEQAYKNCTEGEKCEYTTSTKSMIRFCKKSQWCTSQSSFCPISKWDCPTGAANSYERCNNISKYNGTVCKKDGEMIWLHDSYLCNGSPDCDDQSDEEDCGGLECETGQGNSLIKYSKLCSRANHCKNREDLKCDSSFCGEDSDDKCNITVDEGEKLSGFIHRHRIFACDESMLSTNIFPNKTSREEYINSYCMLEENFSCKRRLGPSTVNRIPMEWLCDGFKDCEDGSDEDSTSRNSTIIKCNTRGYNEAGKFIRCFPEKKSCDSVKDCGDKSDETGRCSKAGLMCPEVNLIIKQEYICDGFDDCPNREDETLCPTELPVPDKESNKTASCDVANNSTCLSLYEYFELSLSDNQIVQKKNPAEFLVLTGEESCYGIGKQYIALICSDGDHSNCSKAQVDCETHNNRTCNFSCPEYNNITEAVTKCSNDSVYYRTRNEDNSYIYKPFVYLKNKNAYYSRVFMCANTTKACAIPLDEACDLNNDCGDWSDEQDDICPNNFVCADNSGVVQRSEVCNGQIDCPDKSDECSEECNTSVLNNPTKILGAMTLLIIVWILGTSSLCLNCLLIISMSRSAVIVLREAPHRFIYRSLVTTIACGDLMVSIYLVTIAVVDSFRSQDYCEIKEKWLTSSGCSFLGFLSTFGNHIALFAMLALSLFRLKTVKHYLWPRTLNSTKAIRITQVIILCIVLSSGLISAVPLIPATENYFVEKYYFPHKGRLFGIGSKDNLSTALIQYHNISTTNTTSFSRSDTWHDLIDEISKMFTNDSLIPIPSGPYSFYSSNGVCLFNYFTEIHNLNFGFVISVIFLSLVCFVAIVVAYLGIWIIGSKNSRGSDAEKRLQMKITIVVIFNIICRVPLFTLCVIHLIIGGTKIVSIYPFVSALVIPLPSVINPFVNSEVSLPSIFNRFAKFKASLDCDTQFNKTQVFGLSTINSNPVATGSTRLGGSAKEDKRVKTIDEEEVENQRDSKMSDDVSSTVTDESYNNASTDGIHPLTGRRKLPTLPPIEMRH